MNGTLNSKVAAFELSSYFGEYAAVALSFNCGREIVSGQIKNKKSREQTAKMNLFHLSVVIFSRLMAT